MDDSFDANDPFYLSANCCRPFRPQYYHYLRAGKQMSSSNGNVSSVSSFYGPGAYGAWLMNLPVVGYGLIANLDAFIRFMRLAWPPGYYRIENDSALAAAAYVTQISFDLAALFTRCYFGLGHFTGLRLLPGILLFLNAVMLGLIVAGTIRSGPMLFPASVGLFLFPFLESSLAAGYWVPPPAIIMVERGPLIAILYVWLSAFLRAFLHGAFNSPTWILLYHARGLVVAPILMFSMPIRLSPQTGAKLTDPDQMVPICSAIVMILYQWRPMLMKWYWRVLEIVSRAFSYRRASGVTTETATQGGG